MKLWFSFINLNKMQYINIKLESKQTNCNIHSKYDIFHKCKKKITNHFESQ